MVKLDEEKVQKEYDKNPERAKAAKEVAEAVSEMTTFKWIIVAEAINEDIGMEEYEYFVAGVLTGIPFAVRPSVDEAIASWKRISDNVISLLKMSDKVVDVTR